MWKFPVKKQHRCSWGYKLAWDFFSVCPLPIDYHPLLPNQHWFYLVNQGFPHKISSQKESAVLTAMSNTFLFLQFSFIKLVCAWFCFPFIPEIIDLICRLWFQNKVVKYRNSESYCTAMRLCLLTPRRAKENQLWMSIKYNQCSPNLIPWSWLNIPLQKLYAITQHSFQNKHYLFLK